MRLDRQRLGWRCVYAKVMWGLCWAMAATLVAATQWSALQFVAAEASCRYGGLQQAARVLRDSLTRRMRPRMLALDSAFSVSRHITPHVADDFLETLRQELCRGVDGDTMTLGE